MNLVNLLVALIVIGAVLYIVQMIPMDHRVRIVIQVVIGIVCIVYLLSFVGLNTGIALR